MIYLTAQNSIINGKTRRSTFLREEEFAKDIEIFYEFDRIIPWSDDTLLDGQVFAVLLYASSRGKNLKVHGAVSHMAMRNMKELLLIWQRWKPQVYKKINIIPDRVDDSRRPMAGEKAITAFSGGVDAIFTAIRNTKILPEATRYPINSALMVHGFDVEMYNYDGFKQLGERVKPLLDDLNIDLRTVRTNSRELKLQNWEDSFALELAGCLHMCSDEFDFGLIGSSEPYEALIMPWGSTPISDHLISGGRFSIIHDGAGYSRTDKVATIKNYPLACAVLKVCWAGTDQSGNCCECEKCVRTQLNFLAAGVTKMPICFPKPLNIQLINSIKINNAAQLAEMVSIAEYAKAHKVSGDWLDLLKARIAEWKPIDPKLLERQKNGGKVKSFVAKCIIKLGLEAHAKKLWRYFKRGKIAA